MNVVAAEDHVDADLRRVAVPGGLERRLALPALFDDAAIDRLLGDVPVPAGLGDRLRNAACAPAIGGHAPRGVDLERAASMVRGATAVEPVRPVVHHGRGWFAAWSGEGIGIVVAVGLMVAAFVAGRESSRAFGPSREQAARQVRFPESGRTAADTIVLGDGHELPAVAVDDGPATAAVTPPPIDVGELVTDRPAARREPGESLAATQTEIGRAHV